MTIGQATSEYESWLGEQIPLYRRDLMRKHKLMCQSAFVFLRATFYRWAQVWPSLCPHLQNGPRVLAVGDLHVENFGTWRDIEGRLVWGVNDFDETCRIPYTNDLVRLAVSAQLAIADGRLRISRASACDAILSGYRAGLRSGGRPFVLAEHHAALRAMAVERLREPERFWERLERLPTAQRPDPPSSAIKALRRAMPSRKLESRIARRVSGVGSLGRPRFVALAQWQGGWVAREVKQLAVSAWHWVWPTKKSAILLERIMSAVIRCPDPFIHVRGRWIVRRLAPDCSRIDLSDLPSSHDGRRLLHAMGFETANIHLGSVEKTVIMDDLKYRDAGWLHEATNAMADSVHQDWKGWCRFTATR
jgi:hypothetical protein